MRTLLVLPALVLGLLAVVAILGACHTGTSYTEPNAPRYAGGPPASDPPPARDTLRVVTYNIELSRHADDAARLLAADRDLRGADVVLLQEMTADATRRIADALGMWWVYYPAVHRRRGGQDFGNAVLARWPIESDAKLVLPHRSRYAGTHRMATAATVRVGARPVRVYSFHLGTPLDIGGGARRDQLRAILHDAAAHPHAIVGGDTNDTGAGQAARAEGWLWPTRRGLTTVRGLGRVDHVFAKGLAAGASGTGPAAWGVSDHRAVWADVVLP